MVSPLNDRLDEVVWDNCPESAGAFWKVYRWMQQATVEIDRLQHEIDVLREQTEANSDKLGMYQ